jgi:hypothetical protein
MGASIRCQVASSWDGRAPESSPGFSSLRLKRLSHPIERSSWRPDDRRAVMSPPSTLCTYSIPGRGEGGTKFRRLPSPPPIPRPSRSRLSSPALSPWPSLSVARRFPLSSDRTRGRIMGMGFGGFPPSAGLLKFGVPMPVEPWALAKRANPGVVVVAIVGPCC